MSLDILATGMLVSDPQRRTGQSGKPFATALLRVPCEDAERALVSVIVFNASILEATMAHAKGDTIAVAGRAKLSSWSDKDGDAKHGLSVVADRCLTPYAVTQQRRRERGETETEPDPA